MPSRALPLLMFPVLVLEASVIGWEHGPLPLASLPLPPQCPPISQAPAPQLVLLVHQKYKSCYLPSLAVLAP